MAGASEKNCWRNANCHCFCLRAGSGNLEAALDETRQSSLINALSGMRAYLRQLAEEERRRTWTISGQAKLGELLRNHQQSDSKTLAKVFIDELSRYLLSPREPYIW